MKICILIPSMEYEKQAGVRIRYKRIQKHLEESGHEFHILPIENVITGKHSEFDVYIISKCYEASALLVPLLNASSRKLVGIDLFDDYFSQTADSRFVRLRRWLRCMMPAVDFILVSTPAMRDVARSFAHGIPVHLMNDPALSTSAAVEDIEINDAGAKEDDRDVILAVALRSPGDHARDMTAKLREKLDALNRTNIVNMAWFGMGDNPYFPVGLSDLAAFGDELSLFRAAGLNVHLDVLTNERAMTPDALGMLRRLPVPYTVSMWTEERQANLLAKSLIVFLPVNAQNFSIVKSLNRAVSALAAGAQVLSVGYPLYSALDRFIYRDPARLIADIQSRQFALRESVLPDLDETLTRISSPSVEADKLCAFLHDLKPRSSDTEAPSEDSTVAVIHGRDSPVLIHKFIQKIGVLSVGTPFSPRTLNYDIDFSFPLGAQTLNMFISEQLWEQLPAETRALFYGYGRLLSRNCYTTEIIGLVSDPPVIGDALGTSVSKLDMLASYSRIMDAIAAAMQRSFPNVRCLYSEQSRLPLWADAYEQKSI